MSFSFWNVTESISPSLFQPPKQNPRAGPPLDRWPGERAGQLTLGGGVLLLVPVLARVALDAARRVDQLLLAGEERVAVGADLQAHLALLGRAAGPGGAAGAVHLHAHVFRVDPRLHVLSRSKKPF